MDSISQELNLRIPLGRLVSACDAMPGVYHVQDPATGALIPVVIPNRRGWRDRVMAARGTLAGVFSAAVVLAASGVWQYTHREQTLPPAVAAPALTLPIAQHADGAVPVQVVNEPYTPPVNALAPAPLQVPPAADAAPVPAEQIVLAPAAQPIPRLVAPPAPAPLALPEHPRSASPVHAGQPPRIAPAPQAVAPLPVAKAVGPRVPAAPLPVAAAAAAPAGPPAAPEDSPVVFNELTQAQQRSVAAVPTHGPQAAVAGAPKLRLVAIKDAQTAVMHLPGSLLPVAVKVGSKLPNGATLLKVDPVKGTVQFDNGSALALE